MSLRANLFRIETLLLCWFLVFGLAILDSVDLTDELLTVKPSLVLVVESEDLDDLTDAQSDSQPTVFVRWSGEGEREVFESVALAEFVGHVAHAVAPQCDLLQVFRV